MLPVLTHSVGQVSRNSAVMMVPGRRHHRIAVLVLSRGISRQAASTSARSTPPTRSFRLSSTSKTTTPVSKKPIHSSAKREKATPALSMEQQQAAAAAAENATKQITPPSMDQLKILFTASAVPMIGFGFMDNLVMIQAGQFIDNTIGVTMGLATMTAAAAGQVVSDVSGVIFGGSLERFLHRYRLIQSSTLTTAQRGLPICRNVALLGAVCGVALGCGLGASCLLFMDLEARERAERALQLQAVLNDMIMEAGSEAETVQCESCTIHLAHVPAEKHFSTQYNAKDGKTKIDVLPTTTNDDSKMSGELSLARRAAKSGKAITNENGSILCTPIVSQEDGEVVAVLEFHSKKEAVHGFTAEDEKAARVMARHIGIFIHRLSD